MGASPSREVIVKCRAMHARLLGRGDYDKLISMKSVSQIAAYLKKQTPYAYVLRRIDENDVHRGQLEQLFKRSLFYDYERLIKFTAGTYKPAIRAMFDSYEIDDLKLVIGSICSEHEQFLSADDLTYIRSYSEYSTDFILSADNMEQLVDNLNGTRYYEPLLPFAARENPNFTAIDHALNLLNYRALIKAFRETAGGGDLKALISLFCTRTDIENILYVYRTKKLYNIPASEIAMRILPCEYKISRRELLELSGCDGIEAMTDKLADTYYGFLFPKSREHEWETLHSEYIYSRLVSNMRKPGGSVSAAYAYLYLKEIDIKNIIMIIEGVRYALPADQITSFIIGYNKKTVEAAVG